jgi:two-component system chemotaxis sensor kinase CheA
MDVVKSNIDKTNGVIEIESELGTGTTIKIKIPLTLAIVPALIITCAGDRYAIPQSSLVAVVHLGDTDGTAGDDTHQGVEVLHDAPVYRWRGMLLPLIYLPEQLRVETIGEPEEDHASTILVLQAEGRLFGLVVDRVMDSGEIVVKPLGEALTGISVYAGATIMGDGTAALIIDIFGLLQNVDMAARESGRMNAATPEDNLAIETDPDLVLMVRHRGERLAVLLTDAPRLEKIPRASVERSGSRPVVQYRGSVLPLRDILDADRVDPTWVGEPVVASAPALTVASSLRVFETSAASRLAFAHEGDAPGDLSVSGESVSTFVFATRWRSIALARTRLQALGSPWHGLAWRDSVR